MAITIAACWSLKVTSQQWRRSHHHTGMTKTCQDCMQRYLGLKQDALQFVQAK